MDAIILDTETTGIINPEPVEIAWIAVDFGGARTEHFEQRYKPKGPISLAARALHHISECMLVNCPPPTDFVFPPAQYLIGHNIDFDWAVIGKPDVRRICTLALCRDLWPDADSHTLGAMLYMHFPDEARLLLREAHGAMTDVRNTAILLYPIIRKSGAHGWEELWQVSEAARVPKTMTFGKYKGARIADVPLSYRQWLLGQPDVDPYVREALR